MVRPTPLEGFNADVACDGAIVRLLHSYEVEPVHDLASDGSVAPWNPFSKRNVRDLMLLSEQPADLVKRGVSIPWARVLLEGWNRAAVSPVRTTKAG